ncbi:MAG: hypothetical protein CMJ29_03250 [Phycisphaerae bacterium]|nr:hypothetical protein [Phycisphaerae bacterium]|tara:strand:- start:184 stop:795 length:612 start_codon:yes stop_codon:yes gene_type:complete
MRRSAAWLPIMAVCLFLITSVRSEAALIVYDDRDAFIQALQGQQVNSDNFENLENGYYADPILRGEGTDFEYSLSSSSIVGLMAEDLLISTTLPKSVIQLASDSAQAIGGEFTLTDFEGHPIHGDMRITLQDGTIITRSVTGSSVFIGVIGVGESVTSLSVGAAANAPLLTVGSMVIAVPAAGTLPLLCLPMFCCGRSRRSRR